MRCAPLWMWMCLLAVGCQPLLTGNVDEPMSDLGLRLPSFAAPAPPTPWEGPYVYAPTPRDGEHPAAFHARSLLGRPYCWGGTGPDCFDCSGLVRAAWLAAGEELPHSSHQLHARLDKIAWKDVQPGDILWRPGHVGIYVGDGWAIHAPGRGERVRYQAARSYEQALRP